MPWVHAGLCLGRFLIVNLFSLLCKEFELRIFEEDVFGVAIRASDVTGASHNWSRVTSWRLGLRSRLSGDRHRGDWHDLLWEFVNSIMNSMFVHDIGL